MQIKNLEEAANYLTSDEFRTQIETQAREALKLISEAAENGLGTAQKLIEQAASDLQNLKQVFAGRTTAITSQFKSQIKTAFEKLQTHS